VDPTPPPVLDDDGEPEEPDPAAPIITADYYCIFNFPGPFTHVSPARLDAPTSVQTPADGPSVAEVAVNADGAAAADGAGRGDVSTADPVPAPATTPAPAPATVQNRSVPLRWSAAMNFDTSFTFINSKLQLVKGALLDGVTFELYESVVESVAMLPEPEEGTTAIEEAAAAAKGKKDKKGKGQTEVPVQRKDLPPRVRCVGTAVAKLPEFLEGADEVATTLDLLDADGRPVMKALPRPPLPEETEETGDRPPSTPLLEQMIPLQLQVVISLPRVTKPAACN
jgi:hypothetical protein